MYRNIPPIMTFNEAKTILRIGKNSLLSLIHSGELEAVKIAGRWKITRESLIEYIQGL